MPWGPTPRARLLGAFIHARSLLARAHTSGHSSVRRGPPPRRCRSGTRFARPALRPMALARCGGRRAGSVCICRTLPNKNTFDSRKQCRLESRAELTSTNMRIGAKNSHKSKVQIETRRSEFRGEFRTRRTNRDVTLTRVQCYSRPRVSGCRPLRRHGNRSGARWR